MRELFAETNQLCWDYTIDASCIKTILDASCIETILDASCIERKFSYWDPLNIEGK